MAVLNLFLRLKADIPTFSFQRLEGGTLMLTFDKNVNVDPSLLIPYTICSATLNVGCYGRFFRSFCLALCHICFSAEINT
jgi:hypothetical protein